MDLEENAVHLWHVDLTKNSNLERKCLTVLSADEHARVSRFRGDILKRRFVLCRGQLRWLLSAYLSIPAQAIEFDTGPYGKPFLSAGDTNKGNLVFNISHSGDNALFGITRNASIGVDIEVGKKINNFEGLVSRCFGDREKRYWHDLEQKHQKRDFFRIWTCKESFIKAVGRGISLGLERCEVDTHRFSRFSNIPSECGKSDQWLLKEIDSVGELFAAVSIDNTHCQITIDRLTP